MDSRIFQKEQIVEMVAADIVLDILGPQVSAEVLNQSI